MYTRELDRLKLREDGMCKLRHWETEMYWIKSEGTRQYE